MSEVVKAGVLEVTVVQATGVDLLTATSTLSRTARRKPALVARVTVDGTTKSGQPAQRSHHPVWFPAQPLNLGDMNASSSTSRGRGGTSGARNGGGRGNSSNSSSRSVNHSARLFGRAFSNGTAQPHEREAVNGPLGLARDRYSGGAGDGSGDGEEGSESGNPGHGGGGSSSSSSSSSSNSGGGSGSGGVARGLLFEVREFFGPTRIVVELVSGGGGGGAGSGGAGSGTVLGVCEARLAEALVGRGGGSGASCRQERASSSSKLKGTAAAGGRPTQAAAVLFPKEEKNQSPTLPPERHEDNSSVLDEGDADANAAGRPRLDLAPAHSATGDEGAIISPQEASADAGTGADATDAVPGPSSTAGATADTPEESAGCLPGGGVFGSWRRRRLGNRQRRSSDGGLASTGGSPGAGGGGVDGGSGPDKMSNNSSGSRSWRSGSGGGGGSAGLAGRNRSTREGSGGVSSLAGNPAAAAVAGKKANKPAATALTLEEVEMLATSDWGGGYANGSARDIWKELTPVGGGGGGGNGGKGKGTGAGGSRLGPAVRLRLRFIPLWDCLADGGGVNGLGALHAAARDGDARLVTSLAHLWQRLSPGSQVLSLPCRRGLTPIQHCIEAGKENALRELLRGIARDSVRGGGPEGKDSPLHTAVKAGEEGMLKMLLAQSRRNEIPSRVLNALRFGLATPPNTTVDSLGSDGLTPLALAAIYGNESMVRCLLEEGANAASVDARGMTPIAHASRGGHLLAVRALLKAKSTGGTGSGVAGLSRSRLARMACAPCKTNEDGMGPIALAAASGSAQVVSELLRADIPYRTRDRDGRTPLHLAAMSGHVPVLRVLVEEMRKDNNKCGAAGGGGGRGGGGKDVLPPGDNTLMMDGGPFKLRNLDLYGRTAHATALLHNHPQAAAFLEAAEAELEPHKRLGSSMRRGSSASVPAGKGGHPPRAFAASPILRPTHGSGSGSAPESGASGRPSPISSGGLESGGSVLDSCNSYEYIESDQE